MLGSVRRATDPRGVGRSNRQFDAVRSGPGRLSTVCDFAVEAGDAGSLGRHSQEEPESAKLTVRATAAAGCSLDLGLDSGRAGLQHSVGQTRLAQQLRVEARRAAVPPSARASAPSDSIPATAASAIRVSRSCFADRFIAIPTLPFLDLHAFTVYVQIRIRATAGLVKCREGSHIRHFTKERHNPYISQSRGKQPVEIKTWAVAAKVPACARAAR